MSKIYYAMINWEKGCGYVQTQDSREGNDIADWVQHYPSQCGWRVYAFTVKRDRDSVVRNAISKLGENHG